LNYWEGYKRIINQPFSSLFNQTLHHFITLRFTLFTINTPSLPSPVSTTTINHNFNNMSAQSTLPLHATLTPKLNIYDPSGQSIHQPEVPNVITKNDKEKKKEESPPMFKCGDRLCIFTGDDYYHLPKEMDLSHWEGDLGDLYNFKQLPYGEGPAKVSPHPSWSDHG
jgi:hypothetical protein